MGDFNINLLKYPSTVTVSNFIYTLASHSYVPLVSRPTRVTTDSLSLIDNIFTNDYLSNLDSDTKVICTSVSDHFLLWHCLKTKQPTTTGLDSQTYHLVNERTIWSFTESISQENWLEVYESSEDVNQTFEAFYHEFFKIFLCSFSLQKAKIRDIAKKPWVDPLL